MLARCALWLRGLAGAVPYPAKRVLIMEPKVAPETWANRIEASRRRRDEWLDLWSEYARLHTNAYIAGRTAPP